MGINNNEYTDKTEKHDREKTLLTIFIIWIFITFFMIIFGIFDQMIKLNYSQSLIVRCDDKITRIEIILPGYEIGCFIGKGFIWLGEDFNYKETFKWLTKEV